MQGNVELAHRVVVVPEDVGGRLRAVQDDAREVDGGAPVDEQLRGADDLRLGLCNSEERPSTFMPSQTI